jgi:hypothetical protein
VVVVEMELDHQEQVAIHLPAPAAEAVIVNYQHKLF